MHVAMNGLVCNLVLDLTKIMERCHELLPLVLEHKNVTVLSAQRSWKSWSIVSSGRRK